MSKPRGSQISSKGTASGKKAESSLEIVDESQNEKATLHWRREVKSQQHEFLRKKMTGKDFNATMGLPVYVDFGFAQALQPFFDAPPREERVLSLFDIPGAGKSTTIEVLAKQANCAYRRFNATSGLFNSMINKMEEFQLPQRTEVLSKKLQIVSLCALKLAFTIILQRSLNKDKIFIPAVENKNGLQSVRDEVDMLDEIQLAKRLAVAKEELEREVQECLKRMQKIQKFGVLIIHIDECQSWLKDSSTFLKSDKTINNSDSLHMHKIIAFTSVLQHLDSRVRMVFTGTSINVDRILRFDSAVKVFNTSFKQLPRFSVQHVKQLLDEFIDVSQVDEEIIKQLVGPPRILEYFLKYLYEHQTVDEAHNRAYYDWERFNTGQWTLTDSFVDTLILFYFNYETFGGTIKNNKIRISTDVISGPEWTTASSRSLLSMSFDGDSHYLVSLPFPFLARYMRAKSEFFDVDVYKQLYLQNSSRWLDAPKGMGYIFQFAVPLELQMPKSPLLAMIVKQIQDRKIYSEAIMLDPTSMKTRIRYFNNNADAVSQCKSHCISMSIDNNSQTRKTGDVSFPLLLTPSQKMIKIRGEAKLHGYENTATDFVSTARRECVDFFQKAEADDDIDVAIFFCWVSLNCKAKNQGSVLKQVLEYLRKPKKIFLVIDDMQSMDLVINFKEILPPTKDIPLETFRAKLFRSKSATSLQAAQTIGDNTQQIQLKQLEIEREEQKQKIEEKKQKSAALVRLYKLKMEDDIVQWADKQITNNSSIVTLLASNEVEDGTLKKMLETKWKEALEETNEDSESDASYSEESKEESKETELKEQETSNPNLNKAAPKAMNAKENINAASKATEKDSKTSKKRKHEDSKDKGPAKKKQKNNSQK